MMWMPYICVIAFAIAALSRPYRIVALIMCGTFILNAPVASAIHELHPYLQPTAWGFYDGAAAFLLLSYGSKGTVWQVRLLLAALIINIILLVDLLTGWNLVYSVYMEAILVVNVMAIIMMGGAYGDLIRTLGRSLNGLHGIRGADLPNYSLDEHQPPPEGSS